MTTSYKEYPDTKIVEIHVDGEVTREEFDTILADMNDFILRFGTIKLLESVATFKVGMDASMVWDGMMFDFKNLRHISHCAVVSDIGWISPLSRAAVHSCQPSYALSGWMKSPQPANGCKTQMQPASCTSP